jgi:hypothetical protein
MERTNYDYAGQDPINGYDLSGDLRCKDLGFLGGACNTAAHLVHKIVNKAKEEAAAVTAIPTYGVYYWAYYIHQADPSAPGVTTVERLAIHADMYLDTIEHNHGDPRGPYDEHKRGFELLGTYVPFILLPGAYYDPKTKTTKIDY